MIVSRVVENVSAAFIHVPYVTIPLLAGDSVAGVGIGVGVGVEAGGVGVVLAPPQPVSRAITKTTANTTTGPLVVNISPLSSWALPPATRTGHFEGYRTRERLSL